MRTNQLSKLPWGQVRPCYHPHPHPDSGTEQEKAAPCDLIGAWLCGLGFPGRERATEETC